MSELEKKTEQIKRANFEFQRPYYKKQSQNSQVHLKPDSSINPGKFKPHPSLCLVYLAHPTTIRALKKDILLGGEDFGEFEDIQSCQSCQKRLDRQFWYFCPYCESSWNNKGLF